MHIFKKSIHIITIIILSLVFGFILYHLLYEIVGVDFNNFVIYSENYSKPSGKIVIIKIDNKSLDELQKSDLKVLNFQKTIFANAIEKLENSGVKAIGIDVVFANKSDDIWILKKTLEKYNNIVIAAKFGEKGYEESDRVLPLPIFEKKYWGAIDVQFLKVVNRIKPYYFYEGGTIESFAIQVFRKSINDKTQNGSKNNNEYIINPIKKIPLANDSSILIRFFNKVSGYEYYSLIDLLNDKIPKEKLEGKIILIGESGTLIHDSHFSPIDFGKQMNGVEFHANILDSIIQNIYLTELSNFYKYFLIGLIVIIFGMIYFLVDLRKSLVILICYLVIFTISSRIFLQAGIFINLFEFFIYGGITFVITYSYRFFIVDKNKRYIENAFSHYLSKEIVAKIAEDINSLKLGGEKRKVTVYFSDIVGFTTISEMLGTDKIFNLLGEYLSEMTDILIKNKGTLDKYIGDAVMGFFNAPVTISNPEYMACITALEQQKRLSELNEKWKQGNIYPPLHIRIGINTGEAMVGNIGSKDRFNYTVIGDHVNLASRLEGVNKEYLTKICVSEDTYKAVKNDFIFRELDTIKVKGKNIGIKIYELVGYINDSKIDMNNINDYEKGLKLYYIGKYSEAKILFEGNTGDLPSSKMILRCEEAINGKIEVINGVYQITSK